LSLWLKFIATCQAGDRGSGKNPAERLPGRMRSLEVVSKPQIMFESKAQADEKVVVLSIHIVCEHFKEVCNAGIGH